MARGRWLLIDPVPEHEKSSSFDLRRPVLSPAPLLWPGLAFLLWVTAQRARVLPARRTLTSSGPDTRRGLAFVASFLVLHLAAAAIFLGLRRGQAVPA
jgi:hypothetical protein